MKWPFESLGKIVMSNFQYFYYKSRLDGVTIINSQEIAKREFMASKTEYSKNKDVTVEKAQRLRFRRFWMSTGTYLVAILATFLVTQLGIGTLSVSHWIILVSWCLFGIGMFFVLFTTNANLRFPEPSLTREQIVYGSFYGILAMYWLPEARPIIFVFVLAPFSFGMLILTFRQFLIIVACILTLYAGLLVFEYFNHPHDFNIKYQLFLFFLFSLILVWFACFGGFVSRLRIRLRGQKETLAKLNEKLQQAKTLLKHQATIDTLTGLPNRLLFRDRLSRAVLHNKRLDVRFALLFIDLDKFKTVNDTLGHAAGDQLLVEVSERIQQVVRESDTVARLGGDEFTVIVNSMANNDDVIRVAQIIVETLSEPFFLNEKEVNIGASIGIAVFPDDGVEQTTLMNNADSAMYQAKQSGRGQYCFF